MRTIKLNPNFLRDALQGKASTFASNLPDDVQLLDIKFDLSSNQILAVIRSDNFKDIAELYPIPEFEIVFNEITKTVARPGPPKIELAPSISKNKPEETQHKKLPAKPTQSTQNMEEEFSPEQRKLLSFTAEGEYVIVKPTQFLKAEWEDINEVVRSLGGKWIKGDIISYWQIPLNNY